MSIINYTVSSSEGLTSNPKVVRIGEVLLDKPRPLLADLPNLTVSIRSGHYKVNVLSTSTGEERTLDLQHHLILSISDGEVGVDQIKPGRVQGGGDNSEEGRRRGQQ